MPVRVSWACAPRFALRCVQSDRIRFANHLAICARHLSCGCRVRKNSKPYWALLVISAHHPGINPIFRPRATLHIGNRVNKLRGTASVLTFCCKASDLTGGGSLCCRLLSFQTGFPGHALSQLMILILILVRVGWARFTRVEVYVEEVSCVARS